MLNSSAPIIGPFGWPKHENGKVPLPSCSGVYLMAFEYGEGFIPYGIGLTSRPIRQRFMEHTRKFISGNYNILDLEAATNSERKIVWKGWGWSPEKVIKYQENKDEVVTSAISQLMATYIFVIELPKLIRMERLEAALVNHFHDYGNTLIDKGMQLSKRWEKEDPIELRLQIKSMIYGLPKVIQI